MRHKEGLARLCALIALASLVWTGCQPAGRYGNRSTKAARPTTVLASAVAENKPPPLPEDYVWMEPKPGDMERPVPILFIQEGSDRTAWNKLNEFWNVSNAPLTAAQAASLLAVTPLSAPGLATQNGQVVKIKVPLGLNDPTDYLPLSNLPTVGKWELGKQLFFDKDTFLQAGDAQVKLSCASCHDPAHGFASSKPMPPGCTKLAPTLLNTVYNSHQFWDGRAGSLEEVVQRSVDDERISDASPEQRHAWTGVVKRLRDKPEYVARFKKVFGTPPTQDAIGKALATYMRTLLSGNSLQDQAERSARTRGAKAPEAADYEKLLDDKLIKTWLAPDDPQSKAAVAKQLQEGYALFQVTGQAQCIKCHRGANYTDNGFHNLGVGDSALNPTPGHEFGRFVSLPIGMKDGRLIGAYKTPTLRALLRSGPYYFHDGTRKDLFDVVAWHVGKAPPGPRLDPEIRNRDLKEDQVRALVLFLKALDGEAIPDKVAK